MSSTVAISKLIEFNAKFSEANADCAVYIDWLSDTFAYTIENFVVNFYKRQNINNDATIEYKIVGDYKYRLCKDDIKTGDESVDSIDKYCVLLPGNHDTRIFYVNRWLPEISRYELWLSRPTGKAYLGCASVYDATLKYGDTLCYWTDDKKSSFANFQELDNRTTEILERKYKTLEQLAASRKYKPGWIYHRMREPVPEVNRLWAAYGYYFPLEDKAGMFSSTYKWKYFRKEAEAQTQVYEYF